MSARIAPARVYNQLHALRGYTAGKRRFSIYVSWSYPAEINKDLTQLDNRFSTVTEVRRAGWPAFESPDFASPLRFQQGIAGSLELFFRAWRRFQEVVEEATGHNVAVYQRVDQAGYHLPLDERVLSDTDTLLIFGLDTYGTEQAPSTAEIEAIRDFMRREGTCVIIGPHHDVGVSDDLKVRDLEYHHHGDALVPRQQRFGGFTRAMLKDLGFPVDSCYGLRPAMAAGTNQIAPLSVMKDLDQRNFLKEVRTFTFHMHLPHYAVTSGGSQEVKVLATQPIDLARPHPYIDAGNREFNTLLWLPPRGERGADVLIADSTAFSTLFGGAESLEQFWKNLANA